MGVTAETDLRLISVLAPAGYHLGVRIREARADLVFNTYPTAWQQRYTAMSYRLRDPSIAWAFAHGGVAHWSALAHLDTAGVFADAARHGLAHGVVIATGEVQMRTVAGFARADRDFTADETEALHGAVRRLHRSARPGLTVLEMQALRQVAAGKRYAVAAHSLGISEAALKARIASARRSLGARTVPEALQIARTRKIM